MKNSLLFFLFLFIGKIHAQETNTNPSPYICEIGIYYGTAFGESNYILESDVISSTNPQEVDQVRSELVFPLPSYTIGIGGTWMLSQKKKRQWFFSHSFFTNITPPSDVMTDDDWINDQHISSTQSKAEMRWLNSSIVLSAKLKQYEKASFFISSKITHLFLQQEILGYNGWIINAFDQQQYPVSHPEEPVLKYKAHFTGLHLGLPVFGILHNHISFSLTPYVGVAYARDLDEHLLRHKISKGQGWGYSVLGQSRLNFHIGKRKKFTIAPVVDCQWQKAFGYQTAEWLEDEGSVPAGTVIENIPHEFNSFYYKINISFSWVFTNGDK